MDTSTNALVIKEILLMSHHLKKRYKMRLTRVPNIQLRIMHLLFFFLFYTLFINGQSPAFFNYQGIARFENGNLLSKQNLIVEITVIKGNASGNIEYREEHIITTNDYGLFSIQIGRGSVKSGQLSEIDWGKDAYFIRTRINLSDGNGFIDLGTTQLYSVPYALYANNSGNDGMGNWKADEFGISYNGQNIIHLNDDGNGSNILSRYNDGGGFIGTYGPNGNLNIVLSRTSDPNNGQLTLQDENGDTRLRTSILDTGSGRVSSYGPNGSINVNISHLSDFPNNGFLSVRDANNVTQAGMYVDSDGNGRIFADAVDSFVDHPGKTNLKIRHTILQGPEVATFLRGTGQMINGQGAINFPDHFRELISDKKMTVMITPLSETSKGIAVIKKGISGFKVKELLDGQGNYEFDWEVKAIRKGYEDYQVLVPRSDFQFIESDETPQDGIIKR